MSLSFMSASRQEDLTKIAAEVINHTSNMMSPTEAVVKAAQDHGLNRHEIQRISEAYNASAQLALMKRAKDDEAIEVDDVIPLASGSQASDKIFGTPTDAVKGDKKDDLIDPGEYKTDALLKAASAIVPEHITFTEPTARKVAHCKTASAVIGVVTGRTDGEQIDYLVKKAEDQLSALKHEHALVADEVAQYKWATLKLMEKVAGYMANNSATRFSEIEKTAKALHGDSVNLACTMLYNGCGMRNAGHDRFEGDIPKYASVSEHTAEVKDILDVCNNLAHTAIKQAEAAGIQVQCDNLQDQLRGTFIKVADPISTLVSSGISGMRDVADDIRELDMPAGKPNESLRRDLNFDRMRAALGDMAANDPVIRGYAKQPGAVEGAFNEIVTLSPNLVSQPAMLRAALRRHLTAGGDLTIQESQQMQQTVGE